MRMMFGGLGFIFTLIYFVLLFWGFYLMYLATKALQIYIANNSNTKVIGGIEPVGTPMPTSRTTYKNPENSDQ